MFTYTKQAVVFIAQYKLSVFFASAFWSFLIATPNRVDRFLRNFTAVEAVHFFFVAICILVKVMTGTYGSSTLHGKKTYIYIVYSI